MQISAEIRWFWNGSDSSFTDGVRGWFEAGPCAPGGGASREDVYGVTPGELELGIKERGGKPGVEIKGLISTLAPVAAGPFAGTIQIWGKWSTAITAIQAGRTVTIKTRWLRKFEVDGPSVKEIALGADEKPAAGAGLPAIGCNLELTKVEGPSIRGTWWTLGFEAFGPIESVEPVLKRTLAHVQTSAPSMETAQLSSYPAWLGALRVD